jgi:phosphatidylserine/phosphatidylglycerophosphate/cardiolipin synthase-like enzyme
VRKVGTSDRNFVTHTKAAPVYFRAAAQAGHADARGNQRLRFPNRKPLTLPICRSARIAACLLLASLAPCCADPAPIFHYAPIENLEHVDVALIDRAEHEIDMAAYVLTDWPILQALTRAADRGVKVRIYLDGAQLAEREPAKVFNDLAETPGVEIRIKRKNSDLMHLKSYQIDGRLLRTGAANFSASGLKRQDNDLIVIESAEAAESFKRNFDARSVRGVGRRATGSKVAPRRQPRGRDHTLEYWSAPGLAGLLSLIRLFARLAVSTAIALAFLA